MYHPVPLQADNLHAWIAAIDTVWAEQGHQASNVIMDISNPTTPNESMFEAVALINDYLTSADKQPLMTVANTIFPQGLYGRHGGDDLHEIFHDKVLPRVRKGKKWSGYYFERISHHDTISGEPIYPLKDFIRRLRDPKILSRHKFEIPIYDLERDLNDSSFGGQCLSHLSFSVDGPDRILSLTAFYRNHFYTEKLLGNLIGLTNLLNFVAKESEHSSGALTVISRHAVVDFPNGKSVPETKALIDAVKRCSNYK